MKRYVSEFDQWLKEYKKQHPDTEDKQQEGRSLLWDKRPDEIEHIKSVTRTSKRGYWYY